MKWKKSLKKIFFEKIWTKNFVKFKTKDFSFKKKLSRGKGKSSGIGTLGHRNGSKSSQKDWNHPWIIFLGFELPRSKSLFSMEIPLFFFHSSINCWNSLDLFRNQSEQNCISLHPIIQTIRRIISEKFSSVFFFMMFHDSMILFLLANKFPSFFISTKRLSNLKSHTEGITWGPSRKIQTNKCSCSIQRHFIRCLWDSFFFGQGWKKGNSYD